MKLRKHSEIKLEINRAKAEQSITSASFSAGEIAVHLGDIYNSKRYLDCGYKNYPDFLAKFFKQMSKSQAYKIANAARLTYWLEGRHAVGMYSIGAMEELLKIKDEQLLLKVWLKLKEAGIKPTARVIKEVMRQLDPQVESSAVNKKNESRIRDLSPEHKIISIFTKLSKNQQIRLLKRLRKET